MEPGDNGPLVKNFELVVGILSTGETTSSKTKSSDGSLTVATTLDSSSDFCFFWSLFLPLCLSNLFCSCLALFAADFDRAGLKHSDGVVT